MKIQYRIVRHEADIATARGELERVFRKTPDEGYGELAYMAVTPAAAKALGISDVGIAALTGTVEVDPGWDEDEDLEPVDDGLDEDDPVED